MFIVDLYYLSLVLVRIKVSSLTWVFVMSSYVRKHNSRGGAPGPRRCSHQRVANPLSGMKRCTRYRRFLKSVAGSRRERRFQQPKDVRCDYQSLVIASNVMRTGNRSLWNRRVGSVHSSSVGLMDVSLTITCDTSAKSS